MISKYTSTLYFDDNIYTCNNKIIGIGFKHSFLISYEVLN